MPNGALETPADTTFAVSNARGYLRYATINKQAIRNPSELTAVLSSGNLYWGSLDNTLTYIVTSSIPFSAGMKVRWLPSF